MIYGMYAIRDLKTGFLNISLEQNDNSAIRNFEHACMNSDSLFYTHGSDYSLYRIGTFDTDTGLVSPCDKEVLRDGFNRGDK